MAGETASESDASTCPLPEMNEEFQFLLCDRCSAEVPHPRLLPCFHNLCSQCFEENKPIDQCAVCGTQNFSLAESPENLDNVFFANLQVKLGLYQKITGSEDLICDNCKKGAEFWCTTCREFLCLFCFRSHQRYLKIESHEARSLKDLRTESCQDFLSAIRQPKTLLCSKEGHNTQILSLYCRRCSQSMCAICALLDTEHMSQRCNISEEIQCRQNELQDMSVELREKKNAYDKSCRSFQELLRNMYQSRNETQKLIQQKIEEMIQMLREKGNRFLAEVEAHHTHQVQDVNKKLQEMDGVVQRITSSQRLVKTLQLYASGQEVLEMHPFLRESMKELRMKQPSTTKGIKVSNFKETTSQLENLFERVTKDKETVSPTTQTEPEEVCACAHRKEAPAVLQRPLSPTLMVADNYQTALAPSLPLTQNTHQSPPQTPEPSQPPHSPSLLPAPPAARKPSQNFFPAVKRSYVEKEMNTEGHPKKIKTEPLDDEERNDSSLNRPGTSYGSLGDSYVTGSQGNCGETLDDTLLLADDYSDTSNLDDALLNISEEEEEEDDDEDDDDETGASDLPLGINPTYPAVDNWDSTIVFFNLRPLPGNILRLVALGEKDTIFRIAIFCWENTSDCIGMDEFLQYLGNLKHPILVGYKLWTMVLPALLDALRKINKEEFFEALISGFLDVLPLIREKCPKISNSAVKNLEKIYLNGQLDDDNAGNCVQTLKDFCNRFEINIQGRPLIACSNFSCYSSLQPLLQQKVLSMPSVKTLALHNISLPMLHTIYQNDPEKGLMRLCRHLNRSRRIGERKIIRLSKIRIYFQTLPSSSNTSGDSLKNNLS